MTVARLGCLSLLLAFAFSSAAIDPDNLADPALQARYEIIIDELRCLVCQNQTIADSNAELAVDLRRQVRAMLETGSTDDEIRDYMVSRYGDFVLYRPPLAPRTLAVWFGPLILLILGAVVVARVVNSHQTTEADD